jgi:hypothetical protein
MEFGMGVLSFADIDARLHDPIQICGLVEALQDDLLDEFEGRGPPIKAEVENLGSQENIAGLGSLAHSGCAYHGDAVQISVERNWPSSSDSDANTERKI